MTFETAMTRLSKYDMRASEESGLDDWPLDEWSTPPESRVGYGQPPLELVADYDMKEVPSLNYV